MPSIGESDMGLFSLSADAYLNLLPQFGREAEAGESPHARGIFCRSCRGWSGAGNLF